MKLNNKYYILRHGEAVSNVRSVVSSSPEKFENPLTDKGKRQIIQVAQKLKGKGIDLIFSSDLLRAKQTAEIIAKALKIAQKFDKRLREIGFGNFNGKPLVNFQRQFKNERERITKSVLKSETYEKVSKRMSGFLEDIDIKYKDKNILIVSHESPLWILRAKINKIPLLQSLKKAKKEGKRIHNGQVKELNELN